MQDPLARVAILPGVRESAERARDSVDALLAHRVLRRRSSEVSAESALRGAVASAALDGAEITLEGARALLRDGDLGEARLLSGALRVSAELGSLVPTWRTAPLQALARLHVLAASGLTAPDRLGRPGDVETGSPARLAELAGIITAPTTAPAIVVAAVVHAEILASSPFAVANGVVARAAQRLVLVSRGLDPKAVSVPEVGHRELTEEYRSRLAGYSLGTPAGVAGWVDHCCRAVELGAREGLAICEAIQRGVPDAAGAPGTPNPPVSV